MGRPTPARAKSKTPRARSAGAAGGAAHDARSAKGTARDPGRRTRILDVAKRHFVRYGFKRTNLDAVAREARCAKGALYLEFPDKRALFLEVVMRMYREVSVRYQTEVGALDSPLERIIASLRFSYAEAAREPFFTRLMHEDDDLRALLPTALVDEAKAQVAQFDTWVAEAKKRGEIRDDFDASALPYVMTVLKYAPVHLEVVEQLRMFSASRTLDAILDILRAGIARTPTRRSK